MFKKRDGWMQNRYCPKCGVNLVNNAVFCYKCGEKLQGHYMDNNPNNCKHEITKKESETVLSILSIFDILIAIQIPISGFASYILLIFSGGISDPSFMGGAFYSGSIPGQGSFNTMPGYFYNLFLGIIFFLMILQLYTAYCFLKQKKHAWILGWIRPIPPLLGFIILYLTIFYENISSEVLVPALVITFPSIIFGMIIVIYFYIRKDELKILLLEKKK